MYSIFFISFVTLLMVCRAFSARLNMVPFNLSALFIALWFTASAELDATLKVQLRKRRLKPKLSAINICILKLIQTYMARRVKRRTSKNIKIEWRSKKCLMPQFSMFGCLKARKIAIPTPHSNQTPAITYP